MSLRLMSINDDAYKVEYGRNSRELVAKGIDPYIRDLVPTKVARVARLLYDNRDILIDGEKYYITRKYAHKAMECRQYVNDSQIMNMINAKISIAMREDVYGLKTSYFKHGLIKAGWDDEYRETEEDDKLIYIMFVIPRDREMFALSEEEMIEKTSKSLKDW
jgi:hypothetical protein